MSTGRLNNPLYDEQGQFIVNQQPEANMFGSFYTNPMGAIGSGVSSGRVSAVANPLDNRPAGGGKGGGKGGGSPQPNYSAPTPRPSMGKGGGKGGGFAPAQNMYGGLGYNTYMGAGGVRPTSVPTQSFGFNEPTAMPKGGMTPLPETNFPSPPAPFQPPAPPAGGGLLSGAASAANLFNQQRQRNDFINSDNELNRIRAEQMALERKARQEALNRSYYDQPAQPLGPTPQPAQMVDPVSYDTYMENFRNPEANRLYGLVHPTSRADFEAKSPQERLKMATFGGMASLPASRNPYDRGGISERDRLDMAYRSRLNNMNFGSPRPQPSIGAGLNTSGLAALLGGGNPFMR